MMDQGRSTFLVGGLRTDGSHDGTGATTRPGAEKTSASLEALIHHCTVAHGIAEQQGEKFLSYMLAMTLQAARQKHAQPDDLAMEKIA